MRADEVPIILEFWSVFNKVKKIDGTRTQIFYLTRWKPGACVELIFTNLCFFSTSCQSPRRLHGRVRPGIHLFSVCVRTGPVLDENNAFTNVWCAEGRLWLLVHLWYSRNTSTCYNRFSETRFDKNAPTGLAMRKRVVRIFRLFYEPPFRKAWLIAINVTFLFNLFRMLYCWVQNSKRQCQIISPCKSFNNNSTAT